MEILRKFVWVALGGLLFIACAEIALQCLPVSTATKMGRHDGKPFASYPAHHRFQSASGWDLRDPITHVTNSFGFATSAVRDQTKPALGVVGDSMVEGSAVAEPYRVTEQLRRLMPKNDAVMLGFPGGSLVSYLDQMAWSERALGIKKFVVFINGNDPNESVCSKEVGLVRCYDPKMRQIVESSGQKSESRWRDVLSRSALAQYISGHLKFSSDGLLRKLLPKRKINASSAESPIGALRSEAARSALVYFADTISARYGSNALLVFDCDRSQLYDGASPRSQETYTVLHRLADERKIPVLDLCPAFSDAYLRDARRTEVSQLDSHWNARGHRIAAEAIAQRLAAW